MLKQGLPFCSLSCTQKWWQNNRKAFLIAAVSGSLTCCHSMERCPSLLSAKPDAVPGTASRQSTALRDHGGPLCPHLHNSLLEDYDVLTKSYRCNFLLFLLTSHILLVTAFLATALCWLLTIYWWPQQLFHIKHEKMLSIILTVYAVLLWRAWSHQIWTCMLVHAAATRWPLLPFFFHVKTAAFQIKSHAELAATVVVFHSSTMHHAI